MVSRQHHPTETARPRSPLPHQLTARLLPSCFPFQQAPRFTLYRHHCASMASLPTPRGTAPFATSAPYHSLNISRPRMHKRTHAHSTQRKTVRSRALYYLSLALRQPNAVQPRSGALPPSNHPPKRPPQQRPGQDRQAPLNCYFAIGVHCAISNVYRILLEVPTLRARALHQLEVLLRPPAARASSCDGTSMSTLQKAISR